MRHDRVRDERRLTRAPILGACLDVGLGRLGAFDAVAPDVRLHQAFRAGPPATTRAAPAGFATGMPEAHPGLVRLDVGLAGRRWGESRHGWRKGIQSEARRRGTGRTSRPGVVRSPRCSYSRLHGMGFRNRTRVPGEARLDGVVRQRRDHPARDARRGVAQPGGSGDVSTDHRPAQGRGPQAGAVGRPPAARHGRPRLRPGEARADARDPRTVHVRPGDLRQPGAGFRQRRTDRGRRHRGSEGALDAAAPRRQDALLLLDDGADGRRRSDAVEDDRDP